MKPREIIWQVLFLILLLAMPGCKTITVKSMQVSPATNWIHIHPGYKVGDYAVFKSFDQATKMKFEITGIKDGLIEVKMSWLKTRGVASFLKNLSYHLHAEENGYVRKGHVYDRKTGGEFPLKIAGPGDYNYIKDPKSVLLKRNETILTKAGSFDIDHVIIFNQTISNPMITSRVTSIYFIHPKVKFGLVRMSHVMESHLPLVELTNFIMKMSPVSMIQKTLMGFIMEKAENPRHVSGMDLVETN